MYIYLFLVVCIWQGLVQSFTDNWPLYGHRCCCRHLYNNLRKQHPSLLIRELFWRAAKATYAQEFERAMNEIKDIDEGAYFWLKGHTTTIQARHMFRGDGLSDTVLNNMCEGFNSWIIKFKGKPIISMVCKFPILYVCWSEMYIFQHALIRGLFIYAA